MARPSSVATRLRSLFSGRTLLIGTPFLWLLVFFLLPFLIVLRISLAEMDGAMVSDLFTYANNELFMKLKLQNYLTILEDDLYLSTYAQSLKYAGITTAVCLAIGYPFAYFMARSPSTVQPLLLMGVMLPFWTSFLLRVYAWKGILADQGLLNQLLMTLGLTSEPIQMLYTDVSMLVGMTYVYLPFMVLPLYANLVKLDYRLLEAAYDLGATPWKAFWLVTVPLSRAGIIAGFMLVFIPALGEFVIPSLLGGPENLMIGRVVWDEMFTANNWPRAAALAVVMIGAIVVPLALYYRHHGQAEAQH